MKISYSVILAFFLLWLPPLILHSQVINQRKEIKIKGEGTAGPFFISGQYILVNTDRVYKDNIMLERNKDYTIDFNKGVLWLNEPLGKNDSIDVSFEEFFPGIKKRYYHRELIFSQSNSNLDVSLASPGEPTKQKVNYSSKKPIFQVQGDKSFSPNLQISGSKSFSLNLGNSDALALSQGLDLRVSGNIAEEVQVLALISDRGSSSSYSGSTKRLEELDKVLMRINSPYFNGLIGDQYLSFDGALSGRYQKKLQGISSEISHNQNSFSVSYASTKGRYCHNSFSGVEGKQGPYHLRGEDGVRGVQVLPGTEKVYYDGELLKRGSDNDYTIDYSRGVLNFTSSRLITSDSRIRIEFEYSDESYKKNFYSSKGELNLFNNKVKLKGVFLNEVEDKENPLSNALSPEDKTILKNSGEDRDKAFKDGAQYVGEGEGDYIILADSLENPYYQYAGRDSGDYLVNFSWVGDSRGSYIYKGDGIYSYVYPGHGDYLPRTYLPLPSSHSIMDLSFSLKPIEGFFSEIGWGLSRKDDNLFSDLEEKDNSGKALLIKTGYEKQDQYFLGYTLSTIKLEGSYRSLDQNFRPFGRIDEIERDRVWGIIHDTVNGSENVLRFKSIIAPRSNLELNTDLGILKKGRYLKSSRNKFGIIFSPFKNLDTKITSEEVSSLARESLYNQTGDWQRRAIQLTHRWKKLSTSFGWEKEKQEISPQDSIKASKKFDEFKGEISLGTNTLWFMSSQIVFRREKSKDSYWRNEAKSYTMQNRLSLRNYKEVLSTRVEYIHRKQNQRAGGSSRGDMGSFKLDYYPKNQALILNLQYSANLLGSEKKIDSYIDVGEGRGDYRYENGEYVPDSEGNFILHQEVVGEYIPSKKLDRSFKAVFRPGKLLPRIKLLEEFYSESYVKTSTLIEREVNWVRFMFNPFSQGFAGEELFKDFSFKQDFYIFPSAPLNLRLRWVDDRRENLLLLTGKDTDNKRSQSILLRHRFSDSNLLESELSTDERKRLKINSNLLRFRGRNLRIGFTRRERNSLEVTLSGRTRKEKEIESNVEAIIYEFSPRLSYALLSRGKIRSEFSWFKVVTHPQSSILPWEMAEGKKAGDSFDWKLGFDFKFNHALLANFDYSGLKEPGRGTKHRGKFEIRANF